MLTPERAERLRPVLDRFLEGADLRARLPHDPVELVHAYDDPADIEVAGLLASALAYGRVDLFKPLVAALLQRMGPSPARFVDALRESSDWAGLERFVYRFNVGADVACLLWAAGEARREHGGLGALFARCLSLAGGSEDPLAGALGRFTAWLKGRDFSSVIARLGPPRSLDHLLPGPATGGACKRLNLYLRWMVRGPDAVDFGVWAAQGVPKRALVIPLDTHVARMAGNLGLTRRRDASWKTALDVTASLRQLDPDDPIKYDFALCHYGMSGACPPARRADGCRACSLLGVCGPGPRVVRLGAIARRAGEAPVARPLPVH